MEREGDQASNERRTRKARANDVSDTSQTTRRSPQVNHFTLNANEKYNIIVWMGEWRARREVNLRQSVASGF